MQITFEKAKRYESVIEDFLKAINHEAKVKRINAKLIEAAYRYFLPFVDAYMKYTNEEINRAFSKKYIKKSLEFQKDKKEKKPIILTPRAKAITITTKVLDWGELNNAGIRMLKPATLEIIARAGNVTNKIAGIEAAFDIVNIESVKSVNRICSYLVTEVGKETKKAINHVIVEGIKEGKSMGRVAKELRGLVGLTDRQMVAVNNYEEWLKIKRPDLDYLKRQKWVERYRKKLHRYRTETISRTESMRATNEGARLSYKDAGYKTLIWSANVNACPECLELDGHEFSIEEAIGMMPLHPSGRCSWISGRKKV